MMSETGENSFKSRKLVFGQYLIGAFLSKKLKGICYCPKCINPSDTSLGSICSLCHKCSWSRDYEVTLTVQDYLHIIPRCGQPYKRMMAGTRGDLVMLRDIDDLYYGPWSATRLLKKTNGNRVGDTIVNCRGIVDLVLYTWSEDQKWTE